MPKNVRMSLVVSEELWQKISHKAINEGKTKNDLILSLIEKGLRAEK